MLFKTVLIMDRQTEDSAYKGKKKTSDEGLIKKRAKNYFVY